MGKEGKITAIEPKTGKLTVQVGFLSTRINQDSVMLVENVGKTVPEPRQKVAYESRQIAASTIKTEIDIRGMNGEEGWNAVDHYIDDAIMAHLQIVRIIHGKGSGILRRKIAEELKKDSRVFSFRIGVYGEGDTGVTVVELKK